MKKSSGHLGRSVSIIGVGHSPCGNVLESEVIKDLTEGELIAAATIEAVEDAGIDLKDIDSYLVGQLAPNFGSNMANGSAMLSGWMGMKGKPGISHDECCCSGNYGLQQAVMMVASGVHDVVLNAGVGISQSKAPMGKPRLPQFTKPDSSIVMEANMWISEANYALQGMGGLMNALDEAAVIYAKKYGYTREQMREALNQIHIMARENAIHHPKCFRVSETYEQEAARFGFTNVIDYLNDSVYNPRISSMLRIHDVNGWADGAGAVIVCPTEMAKDICKNPIEVAGFGAANVWPQDINSIPISANASAAKQAYAMAGITDPSKELDWLSIHDCTCNNWMMFSEDVGYFGPGEAWKAAMEGEMAINGKKPVNTTGGRQEFGHILAPSNLLEMYEAVKQMRGECGDRQMNNAPKVAGIQAYAGGHSFTMSVLRSLL